MGNLNLHNELSSHSQVHIARYLFTCIVVLCTSRMLVSIKQFYNYTKYFSYSVPVQRIEDDSICIEDMMRECGVLDTGVDQSIEGHPGIPTNILSGLFGDGSIKTDANLPSKKVRLTEFYVHVPSYVCLHVYFLCS